MYMYIYAYRYIHTHNRPAENVSILALLVAHVFLEEHLVARRQPQPPCRGTSLIRNTHLLGPWSKTIPNVLWSS